MLFKGQGGLSKRLGSQGLANNIYYLEREMWTIAGSNIKCLSSTYNDSCIIIKRDSPLHYF